MNIIEDRIRAILAKQIEEIDLGNSTINEEQGIEILKVIESISNINQKLSKYQSATYLRISTQSFDKLVKLNKMPIGKRQIGFKEKFWLKSDLDKYLSIYNK